MRVPPEYWSLIDIVERSPATKRARGWTGAAVGHFPHEQAKGEVVVFVSAVDGVDEDVAVAWDSSVDSSGVGAASLDTSAPVLAFDFGEAFFPIVSFSLVFFVCLVFLSTCGVNSSSPLVIVLVHGQ